MLSLDSTRITHRSKDQRDYIDANLELAAITRRCYGIGAPAPLFENIVGGGRGFRVLGARVALSFGLDPQTDGKGIVETLAAARARPGIPPNVVDDAPWKRNILRDSDVEIRWSATRSRTRQADFRADPK